MYKITAYDKHHNRLLLDTNFHIDATGDIDTTVPHRVVDIYNTRLSAHVPDPETGRWTRRTRRIAYFRTSERGSCFEIHFTRYGRQVGVRNYQARRPGDNPYLRIEGAPPIHVAPRVERHPIYKNWVLVVGEGDPYRIDRSDDIGTIIAEATRCVRRDCGWSGYKIIEFFGCDRDLPDANLQTVWLAFKEAELRYSGR
jgi:hypothetical protein